ncbi:hypothetical protein CGLO_00096 [Colletotrichum gloeosporioides Cg-14]|uniref:Cytochrome P450 n=1 Tax=Colletotrichum gloeosporioides (strain Cg-14) TaxID=1237896 RepID=T0M832_COLGC|nr:hypothetical protein CGLO_00096 [Colletotrichum gloeosporioides Cg-14]
MAEGEPQEPTYSRDEFVSELKSYYEFLTHLYLPPEVVRYPPPGGWEHITPDFVNSFFLGKNDTVADLMRHIPYVRRDKEDDWEPFNIYEKSSQVDFAGEVVLSLPNKYAHEELFEIPEEAYPHELPSHVFVFAIVPEGRDGHFILVDTERGTIVLMDLQTVTKPTRLSDPFAPDEEEWRRSATYTFQEFFVMAKDKFRSFRMLFLIATSHPFASTTVFLVVLVGLYTFYCRNVHSLARFPGPPLASLTNFWRLRELWGLHLPDALVELHEKYGDVVRIGPNMLSFRQATAVPRIYKAGRTLAKTAFYDGFTSFNPNLFGTRNEEVHSMRRRQTAHSFSLQSIKEMELHIDSHMLKFRKNLDEYSRTHQIFDLKELIAFFVLDVLGDLAFRYQFDSQIEKNTLKLPPINDHIFLACLMGMMPNFMPFVKAVSPWIPIPWVQRLSAARQNLKNLTIECVRSRMADPGAARKDLITSLINARDPETGSELTELDIQTEAFAFM